MQIGLSSIVGDGFGRGFFHISDLPSGACPPAGYSGTTLYGVEYPVAQGGGSFYLGATGTVANQVCDVPVNNNGSCGTYNDWANVANVAYKAYGTLFYTLDANQPSISTVEVPSGSGTYIPNGYVDVGYFHDGAGSYYFDEVNFNYWNSGQPTGVNLNEETEVPTGGNAYGTGRFQKYLWDGSGGFSLDSTYYGSYQPAGSPIWNNATGSTNSVEVPSGSGNYFDSEATGDKYEWNGSGGYNYYSSWYYEYGTYITDDGVDAYYWDGSGSYYSESI